MSETGTDTKFTANAFRRLAEALDGMRDEDIVVTVEGDQLVATVIATGEVAASGIRVHTVSNKKPKPKDVKLRHPKTNKTIDVSTEKFDCVYWGEAACEKFLVPYYVRFCSDAQMASLRKAISSDDVIALAHAYPTITVEVKNEAPQLPGLVGPPSATPDLFVLGSTTGGDGFIDEDWEPLSSWVARQP